MKKAILVLMWVGLVIAGIALSAGWCLAQEAGKVLRQHGIDPSNNDQLIAILEEAVEITILKPDKDLKKEIKNLIIYLGAADWRIREKATQRLKEIGKPAIPALKQALDHQDPEVKFRATRILDEIGLKYPSQHPDREKILKSILGLLASRHLDLNKAQRNIVTSSCLTLIRKENSQWLFWEIAETLRIIKDTKTLENLLVTLKKDSDADIRQRAAKALGAIKNPKAIEPLIEVLKKDSDIDVRKWTAWALGYIQDPKAIEPLIEALKNDSAMWVREYAAGALGKIKDPRVVEPLIEALRKDTGRLVRREAAESLGETHDPKAIEPLSETLRKESDRKVRSMVVKALEAIKDPKTVEPLCEALRNDTYIWVRRYAARALGNIRDPKAIDFLIEVLKNDSDTWVRREAANALNKITGWDFSDNAAWWKEWWQEHKGEFLKEHTEPKPPPK